MVQEELTIERTSPASGLAKKIGVSALAVVGISLFVVIPLTAIVGIPAYAAYKAVKEVQGVDLSFVPEAYGSR